MLQNKPETIFHDVFLLCHEPHLIRRMYFFYKRMIQTWVRKYESDEYTYHARAQYLQRLETKLTSKELQCIFNFAVNRAYIIPHIDAGRVKHKTGWQYTTSASIDRDEKRMKFDEPD